MFPDETDLYSVQMFINMRIAYQRMVKSMKAGWKTSEFWLTLISVLISGAVSLGLLPSTEGEQLQTGLIAIVTGIFTVVPVAFYIWNRATVKQSALEAIALGKPDTVAQIESVLK